VLFGVILVIPRIRRLRRRVWAWTFVRLFAAAGANWLGWRFTHAGAGPASLVLSLLLFAFSLLVGAKPAVKSADALAKELNALIALNGGIFRESPGAPQTPKTQIFVHPERIIVLGPHEQRLLEIPFVKVKSLGVNPVSKGTGDESESWEVEVQWVGKEPSVTAFHYNGAFAEHLARVTESTLRSQWKKELPIIQA
jgi:hypothetical protein